MITEWASILESYGWGALIFTVTAYVLILYLKKMFKVWNSRDIANVNDDNHFIRSQLKAHQVFSTIQYKVNNEIPTLKFKGNTFPVRQKLFRKILEVKLITVKGMLHSIIEMDIFGKTTPTEWSIAVQSAIDESDYTLSNLALREGIPAIVVSEYMVWHSVSTKTLMAYVNDLAISTLHETNESRTSTLYSIIDLQMSVMVGDAERTLISLNGDLSGLVFNGETIESMAGEH
jgi:hypothetical protein